MRERVAQLEQELAGETAEGETIVANVGRFGPYVRYGGKYASLKEDDPYTVTLERAREVIRLKKETDASRLIQDFSEDGIQVLNGRYGPYITDRKKNAKIPKDRDPKALSLEECRALLAAAPERGRFGRWGRGKRAAAATGTAAAGAAATAAAGDGTQPTERSAAQRKAAGGRKKAAPPASVKPAAAANQPPAAGARARPKPSAHAGRKPQRRAKAAPRKDAAGKSRAKRPGLPNGRARGVK